MSYIGIVENGQIKLPPDAKLPEGAKVMISLKLEEKDFPDWSKGLLRLIKDRDWPEDKSLHHDRSIHEATKG